MLQSLKNIYHGAQAMIAQWWYGFPSNKLTLIGVTGTSGKTTTTNLIQTILKASGKKSAYISTIQAQIGNQAFDTGFHVTTPDPLEIPKLINKSVQNNCNYLILEVSSHGLDQNRVLGCRFSVGVLTSITHEHLDYHKKFDNYLKAKVKLLIMAQTAVINVDDKSYTKVMAALPITKKIITYGIKNKADVMPGSFPFKTHLPGLYNKYNCLAAIAVGIALGLPKNAIQKGIASFQGLIGRYELIPNKRGITIIIDFASKPDAQKQVLQTAREEHANGRIIAVFGCAGQRDWMKRSMMGQISGEIANITIITAEDPRTEDVTRIIDHIAQGCLQAGAKEKSLDEAKKWRKSDKIFVRIPDRQDAITSAISKLARQGDTVLLLGKGHEQSMCYGKTEYPWSEHKAVQIALKE